MSSDTRIIPLRVVNKTAYIWDVDDIAIVRSKHRICGILVGTLPHLSQQNVFLGVPLVLMPEEAALLVNIGAAVFVDDPNAHRNPTIPQLEAWSAEQRDLARSQIELTETKTAKESANPTRAMSEDALRKRREREERKKAKAAEVAAQQAAAASGSGETELNPSLLLGAPLMSKPETIHTPPTDPLTPSSSELSKSASTPYTIVIPASAASQPWYNASSCTYKTIESARAAGVWDFPATLSDRARSGVFHDLWKQGYFMGGGIKFGGEYLVYPGDPLRYHSHFSASVVESPIASLRPMEIVAHGRLGTATKKAHLLCGWDDEKQEVSYLSIEWAGFG
ncbi:putative tRNA-splicing endonuclease subunit tsp-4 [Psilocybe cubensis]|uniref:tRNA-splicing endonuclease subunit Sen34 n=2 Tax=Psilocybe cubensis TaxID=181762 RepID=A0A8H7Y5D9_PSICU|nr:putative tRNA-splicing endonuclease subunit tsp-4 [Psilocybe cubensis]KAH9484035.1 putative tRNA-splicing endonuclease subunit tsp-4 [Psilocybe cubensis]